MGTRNLTAVMINDEYKIAQYGQWDGYPEGQGVTALKFLHEVNMEKFKEAVSKTRFLTKDELQAIGSKYGSEWLHHYPQLGRDHGAEILQLVYDGVTELKNSISFAGDSLFCEYAYVIDFDTDTFEVYQGFNREPLINSRFNSDSPELEKGAGYEPVKLVKAYSLKQLPSTESFLKDFSYNEDEDVA